MEIKLGMRRLNFYLFSLRLSFLYSNSDVFCLYEIQIRFSLMRVYDVHNHTHIHINCNSIDKLLTRVYKIGDT